MRVLGHERVAYWNQVNIIFAEFQKRQRRIPQNDAGFVPETGFEKSLVVSVRQEQRFYA